MWTNPEDEEAPLLPQIQPVVAETTTEETTTTDPVTIATIVSDGSSTQAMDDKNDNEGTTTEANNFKTSDAEILGDTTTEIPVHIFDDDIEDQTPLETIIDFLSETTIIDTSNTDSTTEAMLTTLSDVTTSKSEGTTGNTDPTLDYDLQDKVGVTEQIETTMGAETFDDDVDNFDKISVVTSMSINKDVVEEEMDEVTVVTASPAQPVPSLDDLDLIDSSIQVKVVMMTVMVRVRVMVMLIMMVMDIIVMTMTVINTITSLISPSRTCSPLGSR